MDLEDIVRVSSALRADLRRARKTGSQASAPLTAIIDDLQSRYAGFTPKYEAFGRRIRPYAEQLKITLRKGDAELHKWIADNLENLRKGAAPNLSNLIIFDLVSTRPYFIAELINNIEDSGQIRGLPETINRLLSELGSTRKFGAPLITDRKTRGPENMFHSNITEGFNLRDWEIGAHRILQERKNRTGTLDLSKLRIDSLPDTVGDMVWLRDLSCSLTSITRLDGIDKFGDLEILHCSYGKLRELPSLRGCGKLVQITCGVTPIASIDPLSQCPSIQRLYCGSTNVADLTPLRSCPELTILHCEDTRVSELSGLENSSKLRLLDCSDTSVKSLLPIEGLPSLETLLLNGCRIEEHSPALWLSPALKEVIFCRGSLKGIPASILSRSFDENCLPRIREYLETSSQTL
ncbi:hypothetical protein [Sphingobium sp. CFD-1]|uniref:hypothetical protein n=1 Tax=Sphingobium sp. CFD-1 TaxID=2878545 RepID=UPI00214CCA64|nr:hypothetical protein [Sphingobium sp. CFD-1]